MHVFISELIISNHSFVILYYIVILFNDLSICEEINSVAGISDISFTNQFK